MKVMHMLRRFIGLLGLAFVALGFYALLEGIIDYANDFGFRFVAVSQALADVGLGNVLPANAMNALAQLPAMFTLVPLGALLAWWGLKKRFKPKFRR